MSRFALTHINEIPLGTMKLFEVEGREILLMHLKDGFRAISNTCPHLGGPLNEGDLRTEEGLITCPWHAHSYHVASGDNTSGSGRCLRTYKVELEGHQVFVFISNE